MELTTNASEQVYYVSLLQQNIKKGCYQKIISIYIYMLESVDTEFRINASTILLLEVIVSHWTNYNLVFTNQHA